MDYLNSESETDDDEEDLDSVSVVARTRDRLSGILISVAEFWTEVWQSYMIISIWMYESHR